MNTENIMMFLDGVKGDTIKFLGILITMMIFTSVFDWLVGWTNAKFNKKVAFSSEIAIKGIINKVYNLILLIFFMFVALILLNEQLALVSLTTLYVGYLVTEIHSIMAHLGYAEDDKTGELFTDFLNKILKVGKEK